MIITCRCHKCLIGVQRFGFYCLGVESSSLGLDPPFLGNLYAASVDIYMLYLYVNKFPLIPKPSFTSLNPSSLLFLTILSIIMC